MTVHYIDPAYATFHFGQQRKSRAGVVISILSH